MKKKLIFLMLIATSTIFFSCGKEKSPKETPEEIPAKNPNMIKSYLQDNTNISGHNVFTNALSYDNDNRISVINYSQDPDNKSVYKYHSKDSYSAEHYTFGKISWRVDYFLKNSNLDSSITFFGTTDTSTAKYHYDGRNLLTHIDMFEYNSGPQFINTNVYSYDASGNLLQYSNSFKDIYAYEYYSDLIYEMPLIEPVFPTPKKTNLLKRIIRTTDGKVSNDVTTTYTFDDKNRIHTKTETSKSGAINIQTYTYF